MAESRSAGNGQGEPPFVNTATCGEKVLERHLEVALESATEPETRYHLREALQLLRDRQ